MVDPKTAYVDTDVCISWIFGDKKALDFFKMVEDGKVVGIISNVVLMEFIRSFRKIKSRRHGSIDEGEIKKHLGALLSISGLSILEEKDSNQTILYHALSSRSLNILKENNGRIHKRKLVAIHAADAFHLALAETTSCNIIVTFSQDVREARVKIPVCRLPNEINTLRKFVSG